MFNPADVANHETDIRAEFDIPANWDVLLFGWRVFVSCSALECGDYGGAGSVGVANIKWAKQYGAPFPAAAGKQGGRRVWPAIFAAGKGGAVMADQNEKAPGLTWPALRLVLALVVSAGGMFKAGQWFAAGYTIAATIAAAGVLGFLAGLYPGEPGADDEQGGAV